MRHSFHHGNRHGGHTFLAFIAGVAAAAAIGGYFLYGPRGEENRERLSRWMLRAKRDILAKMEAIEDITEEKYHAIVDEVTARYGEMKHIGAEKAGRAAGSFKEKWEDMRDIVAEKRAEAEREIAEKEQGDMNVGQQGSGRSMM